MNAKYWGLLKAKLRIMEGFPSWDDAMGEQYLMELARVPDEIVERMVFGVLSRFDKRPPVKALLEWGATLGPVKTFSVADMNAPRLKALPVPDVDAKRIIAELRARLSSEQKTVVTAPADPADLGDWGVEYDDGAGTVQRMPARWSEAKARALAAEKGSKYPHLNCRAYQAQKTAGVVEETVGAK